MTIRELPLDPPRARADDHAALIRLIQTRHNDMDRALPEWARRSNPVVRRHLGSYWKTIVPDLGQIVRWLILQAGVVVLALPFPFLFTLLMPAVTVSLFLLPIALCIYGLNLVNAAAQGAENMAQERRNGTLAVLRVAPRPLHQLLASKMAAAVWRQIEDVNLVMVGAALLTAPVLIVEYGILFNAQLQPLPTVIAVLIGIFACTFRLLVEPIMVASLGVLFGAITPPVRMSAGTLTIVVTVAYFVLINLARLLPMGFAARVLVESVLPLILPIIIAWFSLRLAAWSLTRD
jgi:hypothetical protein